MKDGDGSGTPEARAFNVVGCTGLPLPAFIIAFEGTDLGNGTILIEGPVQDATCPEAPRRMVVGGGESLRGKVRLRGSKHRRATFVPEGEATEYLLAKPGIGDGSPEERARKEVEGLKARSNAFPIRLIGKRAGRKILVESVSREGGDA